MLPEQQQRIMGYFIEEAKDHLNTIEQGLLNLQETLKDPEMINEVFRAAHSVKGGAAMLGISSIQKTSHRLEDYFKILKEEQAPIRIDQKLESLFLKVFDALAELLEQLQGPFGLTEDAANSIMAGVEPVFEELHHYLEHLVQVGGGATAAPVTATPQPVTQPVTPQANPLMVAFQTDVPSRLRELLQLFKQPETAQSRQELQSLCTSLKQTGNQFELSTWCELLETARRAIACEDNSYRTLAPVLIKEIKQAQELVLAGRASEVLPSQNLQTLVPIAAAESEITGAGEDSFDFDTVALPQEEPEPFVTEVAQISATPTASSELFELPDLSADIDYSLLNEDLTSTAMQHPGPEVGMAELNSLADLFEGENLDLGGQWQEEEIVGTSGLSVTEPNLNNFGDTNDFADLLFDDATDRPQSTSAGNSDDLASLFGEDLLLDDGFAAPSPTAMDVGDEVDALLAGNDFSIDSGSEPSNASLNNLDELFGNLDETDLMGGEQPTPEVVTSTDELADPGNDLDLFGTEATSPSEADLFADATLTSDEVGEDALLDWLTGEELNEPVAGKAQPTSPTSVSAEDSFGLDWMTAETPTTLEVNDSDLFAEESLPTDLDDLLEEVGSEPDPIASEFDLDDALEAVATEPVVPTAVDDPWAEEEPNFSEQSEDVLGLFDLEEKGSPESVLESSTPATEEAFDLFGLEEANPADDSALGSDSDKAAGDLNLFDLGDLDIGENAPNTEAPATEDAFDLFGLEETSASEGGEDLFLDLDTPAEAQPEVDDLFGMDAAEAAVELNNLDFGDLTLDSSPSQSTGTSDFSNSLDDLFDGDGAGADVPVMSEDFGFGTSIEAEAPIAATPSTAIEEDNALDLDDLWADSPATAEPEVTAAASDNLGLDDLWDGTPSPIELETADDLDGLFGDSSVDLTSSSNGLDSWASNEGALDLDLFAGEETAGELLSDSNEDLELGLDFAEGSVTAGSTDTSDFDLGDLEFGTESSSDPVALDTPSFASTELSNGAEAELDDFSDLEALLDESEPLTAPSEAILSVETNDVEADDFADLEALLGDSAPVSSPVTSDSAPLDGDDFADLEALLGESGPAVSAPSSSASAPISGFAETPSKAAGGDDDFDDLEKLLEDADKTMGGPPTIKSRAQMSQGRRKPATIVDQTMRVPVKQLDNLSNLVGELVVNRNSLEQDQERLRQFLDNLLYQVQQLSDVGQRMRDLYERSLLESSLLATRHSYQNSGNSASNSTSHSTGASFDALEMDRFTGFHSLSQEMIELIVRVRESASDIEFIVDETDQVTRNFRQVTTQLQEGLTRARMVPFSQTADRLPRGVRDNAIEYGKQAELVIEGRETLIDKMILEKLIDPLTHLVNNAVAHGIEKPDVRQRAGKNGTGRITVRAFYQGNQTVISVSDDGAGIDPERIKAKAIEKGLITAAEAKTMSRLDVYDILFLPGFSGADQVTKIAGRGVGMDVVRTNLNEIRGTISIDSTIGKGTTFTIRLPLTLSISKALCCISNRARIAFPMDGVEDMLDVPRERIQTNAEGQSCILWREMLLPFQSLSDVLKYNRYLGRGSVYGGNQEDDIVSIVVLRSAGNFIALQVDQVLGEQEIVIKQLEGPVPKPIGIAGATVLGDGRIMPIADVLELIDLVQGRIRHEPGKIWPPGQTDDQVPAEPPAAKTEPMVLIVDDSITVRELLSMTFNKVGYRVEQARDGQEAWEKLRSGLPCDMVFCDIEMPRMDGLELLSRIQKDTSLNHLPIAMLTSRGADRHRQMAIQLGARGYFTKPYLEEALLDAAQRMLKGEILVTAG